MTDFLATGDSPNLSLIPVIVLEVKEDVALPWNQAAQEMGQRIVHVEGVEACRELISTSGAACVVGSTWPKVDASLLDMSDSSFRRVAVILLTRQPEEADFWQNLAWDALPEAVTSAAAFDALRAGLAQAAQRRSDWDLVEDFYERKSSLNAEENVVLQAVCGGQLNKQIARDQRVSVRTIEQRRRHVFTKMGVDSVAPLAARLATVQGIEQRGLRRNSVRHTPHAQPSSPHARQRKPQLDDVAQRRSSPGDSSSC